MFHVESRPAAHHAHSYPTSQYDAHIHSQSMPSQVAALNLPRQLQRPAFREVPKDNITAVDPNLMAVPVEYIRQGVQQRGEEFYSTAARALSSSRRQAHISHIPQAEYVRVMGSTVPTHILAVYSSTPTTDTVMLYATHALPLTVACAMLPRLPVSRPQPRSDGHAQVPIVPLTVPNADAFEPLHDYILSHNAHGLLARLLSPIARNLGRGGALPSAHTLAGLLAQATLSQGDRMAALMALTRNANMLWRNACSLGVFDREFWSVLDLAWDAILGAMNLVATGRA